MNHFIKFYLKTILFSLFILIGLGANAQEKRRTFSFKVGEEFQKESLTSSKSTIQRANQILELSSVSALTKSYQVVATSPTETRLSVKITKMDNLIDALNNQLHYNSDLKLDSTSRIHKGLDFMLNKPTYVDIDQYGVIKSSENYRFEFATDTLVAFAGILPEVFEKGIMLGLFADVNYSPEIQKGYTWTDSVTVNNDRLITKFWIEDISESNTIIKFSSNISNQMLNSNSNGTYIVDNSNGLIVEKLIYTASTGYQVSAGKVIYAVARSTSLSEKVKKVIK